MLSYIRSTSRLIRSWLVSSKRRPIQKQKGQAWLCIEQLETRLAPSTLGTSTLLEGQTAGSDSDSVVSSGAWTAVSNASWLHTTSSGNGNGLATFTFDTNTGATRVGTLTIAGQTLTVTQAGLLTVASTTASPSGLLAAGATSLQVNFTDPVLGAGTASNYALQSAGPDGLLGSADDVNVPLSASYSGSTATLTFSALPAGEYRLTVSDNITDASGNPLFGGATPDSNYTGDFVVTSDPVDGLTTQDGYTFDPLTGGYGAGELVQGTNNAFAGLNRLQVGGSDYDPSLPTYTPNAPNVVDLSTNGAPVTIASITPTTVTGLSDSFTTSGGPVRLTGAFAAQVVNFSNSPTIVAEQLVLDGTPLGLPQYAGMVNQGGGLQIVTFNLDDYLPTLAAGPHVLTVQAWTPIASAQTVYMYPVNDAALNQIAAVEIGTIPNVGLSEVAHEQDLGTTFQTTSTTPAASGLTETFTTSGGPLQLNAQLTGYLANGGIGAAQLVVDGQLVGEPQYFGANPPAGSVSQDYVPISLTDYLSSVAAGSHTVSVDVWCITTAQGVSGNSQSVQLLNTLENHLSAVEIASIPGVGPSEIVHTQTLTAEFDTVANIGAFQTVPGLSQTITTTGAPIQFAADFTVLDGADLSNPQVALLVDGQTVAITQGGFGDGQTVAPQDIPFDLTAYLPNLAAGTHTFSVGIYPDGVSMSVLPSNLNEDSVVEYPTIHVPSVANGGLTVVTPVQSLAGLNVSRQVTIPGGQDFARTVESFQNPTGSAITTTVTILGNLGSDAATRVFATQTGDATPSVNDQWFGTDGGPGTTAVIEYIHGPDGLVPTSIALTGDNIAWSYQITVQPGQTLELAEFTIQGATDAAAEATAAALITGVDFGGQAAAFLTANGRQALANFQFPPPTVTNTTALSSNSTQVQVTFSKNVIGADNAANFELRGAGPDGTFGTADDVLAPLTVTYNSATFTSTLTFAALAPMNYRLTVSDAIVDGENNALDGTNSGVPGSNYVRFSSVPASVSFAGAAESVNENAGSTNVQVLLNEPQASSVTIPFTVSGTATAANYRIAQTSVTIPAGQTSAAIPVTLLDDGLFNFGTSLIITLQPGSFPLGVVSSNTLTIANTDPPPEVAFTQSSQTVFEDSGTATVTVSQSALSGEPTTVPIQITGTAVPGTDFTVNATPLVIPAGALSASETVNLIDIATPAPTKNIIFTLLTPVNGTISTGAGAPSAETIILKNDNAPTVSFTSIGQTAYEPEAGASTITVTAQLSEKTFQNVVVPLSVAASSTALASQYQTVPTSITIPAGALSAQVTFSTVDDHTAELTDKLNLVMGTPVDGQGNPTAILSGITIYQVTIPANESPLVSFVSASKTVWEDVGTVSVSVQLSNPSSQIVSVPITTPASNAFSFVGSSTINIPAGSLTGSVTLQINDNGQNAPNGAIYLQFGAVSGAGINTFGVTTSEVAVTNNNPLVSFTTSGQSVSDSGAAIAVTAQLSQATDKTVTVSLASSGSATVKVDYMLSGSTITIPAGHTTGQITVTPENAGVAGGNPSLVLKLVAPPSGPVNGIIQGTTTQTVTIVNTNVETVQFTTALLPSGTSLTQLSGAPGASYTISAALSVKANFTITVSLAQTPTANVAVQADITFPTLITFSPGQTSWSGTLTLVGPTSRGAFPYTVQMGTPTAGCTVTPGASSVGGEVLSDFLGFNKQTTVVQPAPPENAPPQAVASDLQSAQASDLTLSTQPVTTSIPAPTPGPPSVTVVGGSSTTNTSPFDVDVSIPSGTQAGYIVGATAFFDANKNGILDPGEPSTTTGADGYFTLSIPSSFDLNGNGVIDPSEGQIVVIGGEDMATLLPQASPLIAVPGDYVLSTLSTLIASLVNNQGMTLPAAELQVLQAFNLPSVDLTTFDANQQILDGNAEAYPVAVTAIQLENSIRDMTDLIAAAPGAPPSTDVAYAVIASFADAISAPGATLDLSDPVALGAVIQGVLDDTGTILDSASVDAAGQIIAEGNQLLDAVPTVGGVAYLTSLAQIQVVAQSTVALELADLGAGTEDAATVTSNCTSAFQNDVATAPVGNVVPPVLAIDSVEQVAPPSGQQTVFEFTVTLSAPSVLPVSVDYFTFDDTAIAANGDYVATSGTLTWPAGNDAPQTIQVLVNGDGGFSANKVFGVFLSNDVNAIARQPLGIGLIENNDAFDYTPPANSGANSIDLQVNAGNLQLTNNNQTIFNGSATLPAPISITGANGVQNTLELDLLDGSVLPSQGLVYQGGTLGTDVLDINDDESQSVTHTITGPNAGGFTIDGSTVQYTDLAAAFDGLTPSIGGLPTQPFTNVPLTFTTAAPDPDAAALYSFQWTVSLGGTTLATGSGANFRFTPTAVGNYQVQVVATADGKGTGTTIEDFDLPTPGYQYALSESENGAAPAVTVSTVLGTHFSGSIIAKPGIAIIGTVGNGAWQYSVNGATWTTIASVSQANALLLPGADSLRFVPTANSSGQADLLFLGWDGTQGKAGGFFDIASTGGDTAFSVNAGNVAVTVNPVPLWIGPLNAAALTSIVPGNYSTTAPPAGNTIAAVFGPYFHDDNSNVSVGVAVTALTGTSDGAWQFSTDSGAAWTTFPAVSGGSALLLSAGDEIRFVPKNNFAGTVSLTALGWDGSVGADGKPGNPAELGRNDFSATTLTAIAPVNRAPTLTNATITVPSLAQYATSAASTVSSLLTQAGYADPDGAGVPRGVAIVGASSTVGIDYMLSGGAWQPLPSVSPSAALLLPSTASLRFVAGAQTGTDSAALTFDGWDQTQGFAGHTFDITSTGNPTAFSVSSSALSITVISSTNHAPTLTNVTFTEAALAVNAVTAPIKVSSLLTQSGYADQDGSKVPQGIAVTAAGGGTWQYMLAGGSWRPLPGVSSYSALLLPSSASLRLSAGSAPGAATLTFDGWDETQGTAGGLFEIVNTDSPTAFSATAATVTIPIGEAPSWSAAVGAGLTALPPGAYLTSNPNVPAGNTIAAVFGSFFVDANPAVTVGVAVSGVTGNGTWQYWLNNGTSWSNFTLAPSKTSAWLLAATDLIRFVPATTGAQTATLTAYAWDGSGRAPGTAVNLNQLGSGGASAFSAATLAAKGPVNTAPTLATQTITLAAVKENVNSPAMTAAALLSQTGYADLDGKSLPSGVAITGASGPGTWQWLHGATWTALPSVPSGAAFLLPGTGQIRFQPANNLPTNTDGSAALTFLGWDETAGVTATMFALPVPGGASAFSADSASASMAVNFVKQAPTWLPGVAATFTPVLGFSTANQPPNPAGDTVAAVFGAAFHDTAGAPVGVAILAASGTSVGVWQYSTDNGTQWQSFPTLSTSAALVLSANDLIRFVPDADFSGTASLTAHAWDGTGNITDATTVNLTQLGTGGANPFSTTTLSAVCLVTSAPTLAP